MSEYGEPSPWGRVAAALGLLVLVGGGLAALTYGGNGSADPSAGDTTTATTATTTPTTAPSSPTPAAPTTTAPATETPVELPLHALALVDISASMDFASGDGSRMDLTVAGLRAGLHALPDTSALGLWEFSEKLDGDRDYLELAQVQPLDHPVGNGTQRDAIVDQIDSLTRRTTHGTGLYDTVLAAYRQMLRDFDPDAGNSLLLFTDGANDDPTSISEGDLIRELAQLQDPRRPIPIVAVGISKDADTDALKRIAAATGGLALTAEGPEDVASAFRKATRDRRSS